MSSSTFGFSSTNSSILIDEDNSLSGTSDVADDNVVPASNAGETDEKKDERKTDDGWKEKSVEGTSQLKESFLSETSEVGNDTNDSDFDPTVHGASRSFEESESDIDEFAENIYDHNNRCFIVYGSQIDVLLNRCSKCGSLVNKSTIRESFRKGSQLYLHITCTKGCTYIWKSLPDFKCVKGQGNLDIAAAVTFAGIKV